MCVYNKRTIKVCISCCLQCPGTYAPSAVHLTVRPCISVVLEVTHKASRGPLKGAVSARKALQGSERDGNEGVSGRKGREQYKIPHERALLCPTDKCVFFR